MIKLFIFISIFLLITNTKQCQLSNSEIESKYRLRYEKEKSFFLGQLSCISKAIKKDTSQAFILGKQSYIKGDIRIKYDSTKKHYTWMKSPWNDNTKPIFKPTKKYHVKKKQRTIRFNS